MRSAPDPASRVPAAAPELTTRAHWDTAWDAPPRWQLPSPLFVTTRNMQQLLRPIIERDMRVLELGCAPGKILAWTAARLGARPSGLDYSPRGIGWARTLFERLALDADLRCEDVFHTTFPQAGFDVVYSFGLVEHFDDPREIVSVHVNLARPGGKVLIAVPDYGGLYGRVQRRLDPENLALHNLRIMSLQAMRELAPPQSSGVRVYRAGRFSPWQLSLERRLPRRAGRALMYALNAAGLLQPIEIGALAPLLVLEMTRQ